MKKILNIFAILFVLIFISSCDGQRNERQTMADGMATEELAQSRPAEPVAQKDNAGSDITFDRKIIKTGEITFETSDVKKARAKVLNAVKEFDGYVSNDFVYDYKDRIEHRITARVPAESFDELLKFIQENADRVENQNVNANDVTEEYIDIESRIKTKKELEERYKELLKKATKVEEMINIERELGNLRSEIESIEQRLKYLNQQISYSTLTIVFYERTTAALGFNTKFVQSIKNGWNYFMLFLIGLVSLWPFIAALSILLVIVKVLRKRKT